MIDKKILNKNVYAALREDRANNDLSHKVLDKKTLKTVEAKLTNNESLVISGIEWFNPVSYTHLTLPTRTRV